VSYNLMGEGVLDYEHLSTLGHHYPAFELFPIPADQPDQPDAVGIALPSSQVNEQALPQLTALVRDLWEAQIRIIDLMTGGEVADDQDLQALIGRIFE